MLNLLTEPLFRMSTTDGTRKGTLPDVYAALVADEIEAFSALRPHQRHAWHAFLVQLGTMALHRADISELPGDVPSWEALIRGLTVKDFPGNEPWQLVVEDITQPAFMQPPASSSDKKREFKWMVTTPDELDMLVTSKNHDLKKAVAILSGADDWIFSLVTLQTMDGYSGAGNLGISRMNGGYGNRPAFSLAPYGGLGAHVRRDIIALLADYPASAGTRELLWMQPWDGTGTESLLLNELAPLYIEVCRRVRLCGDENGQLYCIRATSKADRIEKTLKGHTNDPWTPHNPKRDGLPLTLALGGFTYKRVTDYLIDWRQPALLKPTSGEQNSDEPMQLVARAMVRGQGKTEGYYERRIPFRPKTRNAMLRRSGPGSVEDLGNLAKQRIERIATVQRILSHAIQTFAARGDSHNASPEHRQLPRPWLKRLDEIIDLHFFDNLQDEFEADTGTAREGVHKAWLRDFVVPQARSILHDAMNSLPCPVNHRYRALVNAEGLFEGRLRSNNGLPFLFDDAVESSP